jgi:hypothetical protein
MSRWTDPAKATLEQYFTRMRGTLPDAGLDPNEVTEDLRRHIEEEVAARKLTVVTEQDVAQILAGIGSPEGLKATAEPQPASASTAPAFARPAGKMPGWGLLIFGVVAPLAAIVFEFVSGACAGLFFDPLPTLGHVLLAAFVPAANLLLWSAVRRGELRQLTVLGWANGAALAISLAFAFVFLPLTPYALASIAIVVGVLFYGIGLAPLAPAMGFVSALLLGRHLRAAAGGATRLRGLWPGFALGLGALLSFTLPLALTTLGLHLAASDDPGDSTRGVRLLRWAGKDEILLRACYGRAGRSGELYTWGKPIAPETARFVYYRVHGQPFNAVPPPKLYAGRARWDLMEQEFTWDEGQAGDNVAGRVRGLGLVHSRQDAVVEPEAALAYLEWTLEFKNDSSLQRESRAQIVLPPGGVVSRLTLWIDGEEREAAFGGRSQVKTAYRAVVRQKRDPVMVTTCGPDRVLMQCFPVPANGGRMKVRLGITAPLALAALDNGSLRWPAFAERNFSIGEKVQHSLWVESTRPLETKGARLKPEAGKAGAFALRGELADKELSAPLNTLRAHRPADARQAWTRNPRQENAPLILQTIAEHPVPPPDRVVVVVDGTRGMDQFYRSIGAALTRLPANIDFALLFARDGCEDLIPLQKGTADLYSRVALWKFSSPGGHDNAPALLRAWELAAAAQAGVIVWIHGPQPVTLDSVEDLRQRFERSANPPRLYDVETQIGPDRILEKLDGLTSVRPVLRLGDLGDDLGSLFGTWNGSSVAFALTRQCAAAEPAPVSPPGKEASLHLARLWAAGEVTRLCAARQLQAATELAARHQLVTPISGAVVLETQAQYERAGLQPVPPASVPAVPEPSCVTLVLLLLVLLAPRWLRSFRGSGDSREAPIGPASS